MKKVYVNDFKGKSDSEVINGAIAARREDGIVVISPRVGERNCWFIDEAILLPPSTTVIIRNCTIKLSDKCRDNFFRSANCGMGKGEPEEITDIHVIGEGNATLEGADHSRATGDV